MQTKISLHVNLLEHHAGFFVCTGSALSISEMQEKLFFNFS